MLRAARGRRGCLVRAERSGEWVGSDRDGVLVAGVVCELGRRALLSGGESVGRRSSTRWLVF